MSFRKQPLEFEGRQLGIDARGVLDALGANSKSKSREGFGFIVRRRRAINDKRGPRVTTQGLLQNTGKFGVAVWDVFGLVSDKHFKLDETVGVTHLGISQSVNDHP